MRIRTTSLRSQGYQIGLNEDGISVLKQLNLKSMDDLLNTNDVCKVVVLDRNHKVLLKVAPSKKKDKDLLTMSLVNRWILRDILAQNMDIRWNKKFVKYEENENGVIAHFEDGSSIFGDFLVGADGAKSKVRAQRCPDLVCREIDIDNMGGWLEMPSKEMFPKFSKYVDDSLIRINYDTYSMLMFKFKSVDGKECLLWSLSHRKTQKQIPKDKAERKEYLMGIARIVNDNEILNIIRETKVENLFEDGYVRPVQVLKYNPMGNSTRVTLLGDSAHAMTTHAGLGANTAFLDARDLANALKSED